MCKTRKTINEVSSAQVSADNSSKQDGSTTGATTKGQPETLPMMAFQTEEWGQHSTLDTPSITIHRPVYSQTRFDKSFGFVKEKSPWKTSAKNYLRSKCACSGQCLVEKLIRLLPFINVLRDYQWKKWLFPDMVAGLTVGSVHVPQGMGFAILSSLPAVYGLYSSLFPALIYFFFGTSRHISIGTMAVISLMVGAVVDREVASLGLGAGASNDTSALEEETKVKVGIAMSLSLIVGIFQLAMSCLNLGILATYMSTPFVGGFLTGAAFHIASSQLPAILGLRLKPLTGIFKLPRTYFKILENIEDTNAAEVVIAVICFTFLIILKEIINERYKDKLKIPIPAELILVIVTTFISHFAKLHDRFDVRVIGEIPKGIPVPQLPSMTNASNYIMDAFLIALVGFAICISMAKMFSLRYRYTLDTNQELLAYGLTNGIGSFLHCFAGAQAPPRTLIHEATGGKTQVASIFSCLLLLIVCLALGPLFESLPNCALASIITVAIFPLFKQFRDLKMLWKINKWDFCVWTITWGSVFILDLTIGLAIGLGTNVFLFLLQAQLTNGVQLGWVQNTEIYPQSDVYKHSVPKHGVKVFGFNSPLFFANVEYFKQQLFAETVDPVRKIKPVAQDLDLKAGTAENAERGEREPSNGTTNGGHSNGHSPVVNYNGNEKTIAEKYMEVSTLNVIVIDCGGITYIDIMGLKLLQQLTLDYAEHSIRLVLANCNSSVSCKVVAMRRMAATEADAELKKGLYPTVHDAVMDVMEGTSESNSETLMI